MVHWPRRSVWKARSETSCDDAIAGDVIQRVGLADILRRLADDDAELDFPVGLLRAARDADIVVRADDGRGRLHEDDRLGRHGGAGLGGVVGIVEADADELADAGDTGAEPRLTATSGRPAGSSAANFFSASGSRNRPETSSILLETSRMRPSRSTKPGFSRPTSPNRSNFTSKLSSTTELSSAQSRRPCAPFYRPARIEVQGLSGDADDLVAVRHPYVFDLDRALAQGLGGPGSFVPVDHAAAAG